MGVMLLYEARGMLSRKSSAFVDISSQHGKPVCLAW
jgi:hypothetical protein